MKWISVFIAECKNQRKNFFGRFSSLITLVLWPILSCAISYFTYLSFSLEQLEEYGIHSRNDLFVFLLCGGLVYNSYWAVVQSAGQIRYDRMNGTLEKIFLSPADKRAFIYGRSFGGILFNTWMFSVFSFVILICTHPSLEQVIQIILFFVLLVLSSTIWGGLITIFFLYSRDSNILFLICDKPMNLLSGTSFPIAALPRVLFYIASIFPSSYCIELLRKIMFNHYSISLNFIWFVVLHIVLVGLTTILLNIVEEHNYRTGGYERY